MIDLFCDSFERIPDRIVLDIDDTPDVVHGGQQLALFNAHYDDYCFQPIHIFDAATAKPVLSLLRPGKRPSGEEEARILKHVIRRIRHHWPRVEERGSGGGWYPVPAGGPLALREFCYSRCVQARAKASRLRRGS